MCLNTNRQLNFVFDWRNESIAMKCTTHHQSIGFHRILFYAAGIAVRLQINGWYCSLCCVSLSHRLFSLTFFDFWPIRMWFIWNEHLLDFFSCFFDNFKYKSCCDLNHLLTNMIYFQPSSFAPNFVLNGIPHLSKSIWQRRIHFLMIQSVTHTLRICLFLTIQMDKYWKWAPQIFACLFKINNSCFYPKRPSLIV